MRDPGSLVSTAFNFCESGKLRTSGRSSYSIQSVILYPISFIAKYSNNNKLVADFLRIVTVHLLDLIVRIVLKRFRIPSNPLGILITFYFSLNIILICVVILNVFHQRLAQFLGFRVLVSQK